VPTSAYNDYTFYTYDHRQRMTLVEFYDGTDPETDTLLSSVAYTYDYLGRRTSRFYDGEYYQHLHYTYDGWNIIQETGNLEPNGYQYTSYRYVWLPDVTGE
jgi:hypothetical protein